MSGQFFPAPLITKAHALLNSCRHRSVQLVTAESCTGGLVSALLTEIAGSSAVVDRGFVTYSNEAKSDALGIPMALIEHYGAVSSEVAKAMAEGALQHSKAHISLSITGIAGPDGGTPTKPIGLVHFATAWRHAPTQPPQGVTACHEFFGPRERYAIRSAALEKALDLLADSLNQI
jgi:nicotinamide-nucleotide amidase